MLVALLTALVAPTIAVAQGRSAAILLELPASARAASLGDAFGAARGSLGDPSVLFYNPGQLADAGAVAVALSVDRYLAASTLGSFALARRVGRVVVGAGVLALDYPEAEEIVPDGGSGVGIPTGARVSAHDLAAGVAAAANVRKVRLGVGLRYVRQTLPGIGGGTVSADIGAARDLAVGEWGRVALSAALLHVGAALRTGASEAPLPRTWRAGLAADSLALARGRWLVLAELTAARDGELRPRFGIEGAWDVGELALAGRAGLATRGQGDLARPLTLGAGLGRGRVSIDYAWRRFDALGDTHRVGARWRR